MKDAAEELQHLTCGELLCRSSPDIVKRGENVTHRDIFLGPAKARREANEDVECMEIVMITALSGGKAGAGTGRRPLLSFIPSVTGHLKRQPHFERGRVVYLHELAEAARVMVGKPDLTP